MPPGNGMRLLQVADREFRQLSSKPAPIAPTRKIKAIIVLGRVNTTRVVLPR